MHNSGALQRVDFSFLDKDGLRSKYALGPKQDRMRFFIGGIRCSKCVRNLEDLTLTLPGLREFRIEMGRNLAQAEVDSAVLSFADLAEKISSLGFRPIPLPVGADEEEIARHENRVDLIRLAVAGFCAGNIMTFSFATYFGDTGSMYPIFAWLSFILYLPVVTYVAAPFYIGAWNSLRNRQLSIDLPMAVASIAGFIFSTFELFRGKGDIYFDSLSGFLFLILIARRIQRQLQRKFLSPQETTESLQLERFRRVNGTGWTWTSIESLKVGDKFLLSAMETLPADAELVSRHAHFSMAWLSGEIKAKTFLQGALIPAGARLTTGEVELIAVHPLKDTNFGQILEEVQKFSLTQNRAITKADRWAQWLLMTVFGCALLFLVSYWHISSEEAIRRSLALIVLACPCAMAFGVPLALASALRKAKRRGLIVRSANAFENARQVKTVFFDKTGTLTETELSLRETVESVPTEYQKIVLSLENTSVHPIAFAFRQAFPSPNSLHTISHLKETAGQGVSGYICEKFYELRSDRHMNPHIGCTLFEDQLPIFKFSFEAAIKPDCLSVLQGLRQKGLRVVLLSGDRKEVVYPLAQKLGFASQDTYYGVDPHQKAAVVAQAPHSMMVGDGVNDSLAMMRASVGVATSGGVESALRSSDVYLTESSLMGVRDLFAISDESFALIRQNLRISVAYNLIGGSLALFGLVNPLVAAILMPVSSGFILLSTWLKGRK